MNNLISVKNYTDYPLTNLFIFYQEASISFSEYKYTHTLFLLDINFVKLLNSVKINECSIDEVLDRP